MAAALRHIDLIGLLSGTVQAFLAAPIRELRFGSYCKRKIRNGTQKDLHERSAIIGCRIKPLELTTSRFESASSRDWGLQARLGKSS
jgi:hypothetical protein